MMDVRSNDELVVLRQTSFSPSLDGIHQVTVHHLPIVPMTSCLLDKTEIKFDKGKLQL